MHLYYNTDVSWGRRQNSHEFLKNERKGLQRTVELVLGLLGLSPRALLSSVSAVWANFVGKFEDLVQLSFTFAYEDLRLREGK